MATTLVKDVDKSCPHTGTKTTFEIRPGVLPSTSGQTPKSLVSKLISEHAHGLLSRGRKAPHGVKLELDWSATRQNAHITEKGKVYDFVPYKGVQKDYITLPDGNYYVNFHGPYKRVRHKEKHAPVRIAGKYKECVVGWVGAHRGEKVQWHPVGCNSLKCRTCATKVSAKIRAEYYTGMVNTDHVIAGLCLCTLTVPAPRLAQDRKTRLPASYQRPDVWERRHYTHDDWHVDMHYAWRLFLHRMRRWANKRGLYLAGIKTVEYTKQDWPHIHFVVYDKNGNENWALEHNFDAFVSDAWKEVGPLSPDITHVSVPGEYHKGKKIKSPAHAFNYVTKYIGKQWQWHAPGRHAYDPFGQPAKAIKVYRDSTISYNGLIINHWELRRLRGQHNRKIAQFRTEYLMDAISAGYEVSFQDATEWAEFFIQKDPLLQYLEEEKASCPLVWEFTEEDLSGLELDELSIEPFETAGQMPDGKLVPFVMAGVV